MMVVVVVVVVVVAAVAAAVAAVVVMVMVMAKLLQLTCKPQRKPAVLYIKRVRVQLLGPAGSSP
jgi:hypothetical protein